jgi:hypothetical protein
MSPTQNFSVSTVYSNIFAPKCSGDVQVEQGEYADVGL